MFKKSDEWFVLATQTTVKYENAITLLSSQRMFGAVFFAINIVLVFFEVLSKMPAKNVSSGTISVVMLLVMLDADLRIKILKATRRKENDEDVI